MRLEAGKAFEDFGFGAEPVIAFGGVDKPGSWSVTHISSGLNVQLPLLAVRNARARCYSRD